MEKNDFGFIKIGENISFDEALDLHQRLSKAIDSYIHKKVEEFFYDKEDVIEFDSSCEDSEQNYFHISEFPSSFTIQADGYYYIEQDGNGALVTKRKGDVIELAPNKVNSIQKIYGYEKEKD
jgi:hypothetical protein